MPNKLHGIIYDKEPPSSFSFQNHKTGILVAIIQNGERLETHALGVITGRFFFSTKPELSDSVSYHLSRGTVGGRREKAKEQLFARVHTRVGHQARVIGNQEGGHGFEVSVSKAKDSQLLITPTETA